MSRAAAPFADEWLVRALLGAGRLSREDADGLDRQGSKHAAAELVRRGLVSKESLARTMRELYRIDFEEGSPETLDKLALSLVPERLCRRHGLVPLRLREESLVVLTSNPLDGAALDEVAAVAGRPVVPALGLAEDIEGLLAAGYGADGAVVSLLRTHPDEASVTWLTGEREDREEGGASAIGAPVVRLADVIVARAVRLGASDIHIEHEAAGTVVRYRVDGDLRAVMRLPRAVGAGPLVSRVKIMADMDVADRRRPQDGRAKLRVGGAEIGLRVSTMPTSYGEKAVLRLLDRRHAEVPLASLGFHSRTLARLEALARSPQGLLLVTGPTGSGKTTTLYSLLHRVKAEDLNVVTVEDPIEYRLEGINQVQVNEKAGMDFASVLRSVLRQDPDIVLVGEIRDRETAEVAFQAALTGHMVFSTLHTNDSLATVGRLLDMGVERYRLAPALAGVVSQRLLRRVCEGCRRQTTPGAELAALLEAAGLPARTFKGEGCQRCGFTGLSGRVAAAELLDLGEQSARDALAGLDASALRAQACARGWLRTLADDVLFHLSEGRVPVEEAAAYLRLDAERPRPAARAARARKVLIVDDNADNRALIVAALGADGYELSEADGGREALRKVAADKPDLVLLDLMMPELDGYGVVRQLREGLGLLTLPVLVLTALGEADSQAKALELGADDYLTKPFSPKVLRARVKALFRRVEYGA